MKIKQIKAEIGNVIKRLKYTVKKPKVEQKDGDRKYEENKRHEGCTGRGNI